VPSHPDPSGNWFVGFPAAIEDAAIDPILASAPPFLRPFQPADRHVTLAFLGRLPAMRVDAVRERLATLAVPSIEAQTAALTLLPSARRPTAVAFRIGRGGNLVAAAVVRHRPALLDAAGCPPDPRPPLPHLTIARPPRRPATHDLHALRRWIDAASFAPIPVRLGPPRLFGWSPDRPARQFVVVE